MGYKSLSPIQGLQGLPTAWYPWLPYTGYSWGSVLSCLGEILLKAAHLEAGTETGSMELPSQSRAVLTCGCSWGSHFFTVCSPIPRLEGYKLRIQAQLTVSAIFRLPSAQNSWMVFESELDTRLETVLSHSWYSIREHEHLRPLGLLPY